MMSFGVPEVRELAERNVAVVTYTGNYMGNVAVYSELIGKICGWAASKGLLAEGVKLSAAYTDDPGVTPPDELNLKICLEVPEGTEPEGDIDVAVMPGGRYVVLHAEIESAEQYGPAWEAVFGWMEENGVGIDMSRPSYEMYLNNPEEHPQGHHIIDICMSAK